MPNTLTSVRRGLAALLVVLSLATPVRPARGLGLEGQDLRDPPQARNVLLVTIDTWRWDYLGALGTRGVTTPNLDRLAREGVLFVDTRSPAPVTLVAHASILTGTPPTTHGVHNNGSFLLDSESRTLAEVLSAAGYRTGAVTGAYVLHSRFGLDQGFERYIDVAPRPGKEYGTRPGYSEIPAGTVTARALELIDGCAPEERWFLWVHYFDPHAPYEAPARFDRGTYGDPYAAEVAYVDDEIGRLRRELENRGQWESTVVVVTSDHGEGLGDHGEETHGIFVYESTVRVSTIVRIPDGSRGRIVSSTPALCPWGCQRASRARASPSPAAEPGSQGQAR